MIPENEKFAEIKFDKYDSYLIKDIEKQLEIDLCDNGNFIAVSNVNGIDIKFPAFALKKCDNFISIHGVVNIEINSNNETLIDHKFVPPESNIENEVLKATNQWMVNKYRKRLLYLITWDSLAQPSFVNNKINETLFAVKKYYDSIAISSFKKNLNKLDLLEVKTLRDKFDFKIGFKGYKLPTPPPPPPKSKDIE